VVLGSKGKVERFKARFIAKGFTRGQGVDSHVSNKSSFRIVMVLLAHYNLKLHQMNVEALLEILLRKARTWGDQRMIFMDLSKCHDKLSYV
jgi:hypothetical protein